MLSKEELEQLGKLLDARLDTKLEPIKRDLAGVRNDLTEVKTQLNTVELKVAALNTKIDKVQSTVDIVQSVMVEHNGKLEVRVQALEEHTGLVKPDKN